MAISKLKSQKNGGDIKKTIVNELFKARRKHFQRRSVRKIAIDDLWQADLSILIDLAKYNDGFKYLLCIIDVFSRFAFVIPLKTKTGTEVMHAFQKLFSETGRTPTNLQTDLGTEFYNRPMEKLLNKFGINHYSTYTEMKANYVERFQRTFKGFLFKNFAYNGSYRYVEILKNLVDMYNAKRHRGLGGLAPKQVLKRNEKQIFEQLYQKQKVFRAGKFKVGDHVRIVSEKNIFEKGYEANFSPALFLVSKVQITDPPTYKVKDLESGKELSKSFYEPEMQKTRHPHVYLIHKVLKRKNGQALVSWLGYSNKYNSWIPESDIV